MLQNMVMNFCSTRVTMKEILTTRDLTIGAIFFSYKYFDSLHLGNVTRSASTGRNLCQGVFPT